MKGTGKVYALKILNKVEMLKRHQVPYTMYIFGKYIHILLFWGELKGFI